MWSENLPNGKVKFAERYYDPMTGKHKRVSVVMEKDTTRTRKAAQQALDEKIREQLKGAIPKNTKMTMSELRELYLTAQKRVVKASSWKQSEISTRKLCEAIGEDVLINALSAGYVRQQLEDVTPSIYNRRIKYLVALMRWAYENDYVEDIRFIDKLKRIPDKKKSLKLQRKYLEADELTVLIGSFKIERWQLLTEFLALSGLRISEATALLMDDVDFRSRCIHVTKTYDIHNHIVTSTKTGTSTREIFMQPELEGVCRRIRRFTLSGRLKYGYSTDLFFCDVRGEHIAYRAYHDDLLRVSKKALGRSITPHTLRHTHTSLMAAAGVPLETISRRLGHANDNITRDIYLHVTQGLKERDRAEIANVKLL